MKLLTEYIANSVKSVEVLDEATNTKRQFIEGIFLQADVVNRNHRIYPLPILAKEAARYITENVTKRRAFGELNHPSGPNVNGDRIAIHIRELHQDGNNFKGKALVASTPMGKIVEGLLHDGASLGVSSRALGSLKPYKEEKEVNEVQDDLRLLAIDVVTDPSAPDAWVNGIMEGHEWVYNAQTGVYTEQKIAKMASKVKKMSVKQIEERKLQLFESFLKTLQI